MPSRLPTVGSGVGALPSSDRGAQRAQDRLAKIVSLRSTKDAATSAAHQGVVARPMDKQISKILQMKRDQFKQRGTSVYRMREDEEDPLYEEDLKTNSVARAKTRYGDLPLVRLPPGILKPRPKKKTDTNSI